MARYAQKKPHRAILMAMPAIRMMVTILVKTELNIFLNQWKRMLMTIQYENTVIWQPCLFNHMAGADVRSPYGEFAKRQGIIHFAFFESRKLSH